MRHIPRYREIGLTAMCVHCGFEPRRLWALRGGLRTGRYGDEYGRGTWVLGLGFFAIVYAERYVRYADDVNDGTPCQRCDRAFNGREFGE